MKVMKRMTSRNLKRLSSLQSRLSLQECLILEEAPSDPPLAYAIFTGHVLETSIITNPVTDHEFIWAKVRTLGGEVDMVSDPVLLNGPVVKGGVVSGSFWLSGRIVTPRLTGG